MSKPFDPYHVWLGIPPGKRPPTHYQLLGIAPDEQDRDVIQAAVLRLSAYVRNFQIGKHADDSTRILNELAEAKRCLLDPASRARYDESLSRGSPPRPAIPAAPVERPARVAPAPLIEFEAPAVESPRYAPRALRPPRPLLPAVPATPRTSPGVWLLPAAVFVVASVSAIAFALRLGRPTASRAMLEGQVTAPQPIETAASAPPPRPVAAATTVTDLSAGNSVAPAVPPTVVEQAPAGGLANSGSPFSTPPTRPPTLAPSQGVEIRPPDLSETVPETPRVPSAVFIPPDERRPVPTGAALGAARKEVDNAFNNDFKTAKTAEQRLSAVHKLYYGAQTAEKPILRYAYLEECRDRAVNLGEAGLACQAIEEMGRRFQIEMLPEKLKALNLSLDKSRRSQQAFTIAMLAMAIRNRAAETEAAAAEPFDALAAAAQRKADTLALNEALATTGRPPPDARPAANARSAAGGRQAAWARAAARGGRDGAVGFTGIVPQPGLACSLYQGSDFQQELVRRVDRGIDFQFGFGSAHPSLPNDGFSIRWTGWLRPPLPGKYTITAVADDGVRVTIDGEKVIDSWQPVFAASQHGKEVALTSRPQPIVVEYHDHIGAAGISLRWAIKDLSTEHAIPAEAFSHEPMIGEL